MTEQLLQYFNGDNLAASVWESKYQLKDPQGKPLEETPEDMHERLAKEFARIEQNYKGSEEERWAEYGEKSLSPFGRSLMHQRQLQFNESIEDEIFEYFNHFKWIVPQGSIMSILGNPYKVGSLSNCFVIPSPYDSYGGILKTDEQLVQLMKRRGGVGANISTLRPNKTIVSNAAGSSTGAPSFMHRYSNSTREVAQDGRRGALMLLLHCLHPDIFNYVKIKSDRTKVTGANISVLLTNKFMEAADKDHDFYCCFPIEDDLIIDKNLPEIFTIKYNELVQYQKGKYIMRIKAKELFDLIIEQAHDNAEPGIAFIDRIIDFSPDGVYEMFKAIASNPCGEQWLPAYDSCRLFAANLFSLVDNPFTSQAQINPNKVYEIFYMQQRLADDLIDLELEHIEKIIEKIKNDPEPEEIKRTELELWQNVYKITKAGRRTGCGFTGLGDMLAALNLKYDSPEAIDAIQLLCKTKMEAELDCTIDLAILRGTFEGWNPKKEFGEESQVISDLKNLSDVFVFNKSQVNDFYNMFITEFPEQVKRMYLYGRRNVSWSTVAPTGTVSIMTQTTSGIEPLFLPYHIRRVKVNPNDKDVRIDFTDKNGDNWTEHIVLHPKFKDWIINTKLVNEHDSQAAFNVFITNKLVIQELFEQSPWYKSCANDIFWENRIHIQSIIQKYTTNAISSTINLPNDVSKEEVASIYKLAWKMGLKGVTVYRDGCRDGVLISSKVQKEVAFSPKDAVKRPETLECDVFNVVVKGKDYAVFISILENHPYEVFVIPEFKCTFKHGKIDKIRKGRYDFFDEFGTLQHPDIGSQVTDEESAIARLVSTSLRHGTSATFLVDQLNKSHGPIVGFSKAIARVLKKYVKDGETKDPCPECGTKLVREEGCLKCPSCGYSKCG